MVGEATEVGSIIPHKRLPWATGWRAASERWRAMARRDALLRLHKSLTARRTELRKRLGMELNDLGHAKQSSAAGDSADAAFDSSGEELASQLAELESRELQQIE